MPAPYDAHRTQIESLLAAWGMPPAFAARTAEVMAYADLHGIDSHGISMIPAYHERHRTGRVNMAAQPRVLNETPVSALIDAYGGLGHEPSRQAMELAVAKAHAIGVGVVTVRNSSHFGAAGFYTRMAAQAGLIGMSATSASVVQVAPTGGAQARLGTDPWSFAAPSADGNPFVLDMATTTVAAGRIRNKANENLPAPPGWLLTRDGLPSTDPLEAVEKGGFLTSLGGSPEGGSYKGYGLSMMVNILGSCLSGATLVTDPMHTKKPQGHDIGHFVLALRPTLFREEGAFESDVTTLCNTMRETRPIDPAKPVMVAGDPERQAAEARMRDGIPVGPNLLEKIRAIADESGVPSVLSGSQVRA